MIKRLLLLTLIAFFHQLSGAYSQITIGTVDPGPYTPGSSIAATFKLPEPNCLRPGNKFELYLSDATGSFAANNLIGSYTGFYSTFVNGTIPLGTPAGTNYRLEIRSTTPVSTSTISAPFEIKAGTPVTAGVNTVRPPAIGTQDDAFGYCPGRDNAAFTFSNNSTLLSAVTGIIKNDATNANVGNIDFTVVPAQSGFTAALGYYTLLITAKLDGTVATKAYLLLNTKTNNSFGTQGGSIVCLPGGFLQFPVGLDDAGIKNNYPGTEYHIDWGDSNGVPTVYTLCDLQPSYVRHEYLTSSCGRPVYNTGTGPRYNVFGINISAVSPFCGSTGGELSTYVKVVTKPENRFTVPPNGGCVGQSVTFVNNSIAGQNEANTVTCTENDVTYNWYVDGVLVLSDVPRSTNLRYTFNAPKKYLIKLESINNDGQCNGEPVTQEICVHNPPIPDFEITGANTPHCAPFAVTATDKSILDNSCGSTHTYNWVVTKSGRNALPTEVSFTNGVREPTFTFLKQGRYEITLQVTTLPCTMVSTQPPQVVIIIDSAPKITLNPEVKLCKLGTYDYNDVTAEPTNVQFSGTEVDQPDTYTWSVTAEDGSALTNADFSFENGTTPTTKYPSIQFKQYITYKVSVTHKNSCGSLPNSQLITFYPSPVATITADKNPICYNESVNLSASITGGTYTATRWVGAGTFSNQVNSLTTNYIPTQLERDNKKAIITIVVTTGLTGQCAEVYDDIQIDISPYNSGTNTEQKVCTEIPLNYDPSLGTSLPLSTFSWTATNPDMNAGSSFSTSGSGKIVDMIINSSTTANAVVIYTITPRANNCDGVSFTFTVTVYPKPAVTATPTSPTICSGTSAGITLTPTLPNTKYTWTSTGTGGVTGSNQTVPIALPAINEILTNTGTIQETVTYKITPISETGCPGQEVTVTVNVDPGITQATAGPNESICDRLTYTLGGNQPKSNETGTWTLTSGQTGVSFFPNEYSPTAEARGLVPGNAYTFTWTITAPGVCNPSSANVTITVNPPTIPGTIDGTNTVCEGANTGTLNLTGNLGTILRWESSTDGGTTWIQISNTTASLTYNNITTTTQYFAVVQNGSCDEKPTNIITITVTPAGTQASAGSPQTLCNQTTTMLDGNIPDALKGEIGVWTVTPSTPGLNIADPSDPKTRVTGLVIGQTYTFTWTITGTSACGPSASNVEIKTLPQIDLNSIGSTSALVCSGQTVNLIGSTPIGGDGTYSYKWEFSIDGGTSWSLTGGDTRDLTLPIVGTTIFRRTVTSATCTNISLEYTIVALPPITNNTIAQDQSICNNSAPLKLTGTTPAGADGNFNYEWEQSTDQGATWTSTNSLQPEFQPPILTNTTYYRRIVSTITCNGDQRSISNTVIITVKPDAIANFTYTSDKGCPPFEITAQNVVAENHPVENDTYSWYANNAPIGNTITFPGYTIQNSNESVIIKLVVTPKIGCATKEYSHTFSTNQSVPATFTTSITQGCGPLLVNFTNTSIQGAGATFLWDFGNGQTSTQANPAAVNFQPDPTGKDTTYVVTLTSTTTCGSNTSTPVNITVKSGPKPVFSPSTTNGCSPLNVTFSNNSPLQNDIEYFFDFGDGSPIVRTTDRSDVTHVYTTTTNTQSFIATMTARNECGNETSVPYTIVVKPNTVRANLVVNGDQLSGCAPFTATFDNNSTGATSFSVDFKDGSQPRPSFSAPERFQHIFTVPGTYQVTLTATNGCSTSTANVTITVLPQPSPSFNADNTLGCPGMAVQFRNTTPDAEFTSFVWDFGDGSTPSTSFEPPPHVYNGDQEYYTVTLTATNALGCPNTMVMNQYIHIVQPPVAIFNVTPSTLISIPNYTFTFVDESTNSPTIWEWDFGDGTTSALQSPSHTYPDTGTYKVTLKVLNQQGCFSTTFKNVTIKGVPGYLFVPNSFIPGSEFPDLRTFTAKGSGIESWRFSVFNKWGELLWETTKLEEGRPAEGWDGTFKGADVPQGVYFWKIDVKMVNGTEWKGMTFDKSAPKRTGPIHLIR